MSWPETKILGPEAYWCSTHNTKGLVLKIAGNVLQKLLRYGRFPSELARGCNIAVKSRHVSALDHFLEIEEMRQRFLLVAAVALAAFYFSINTPEKLLLIGAIVMPITVILLSNFSPRSKKLIWFEENLQELRDHLELLGPKPYRELHLMSFDEIRDGAWYILTGYAMRILEEEAKGAANVDGLRDNFKEMYDLFRGYGLLGYNYAVDKTPNGYGFFFDRAKALLDLSKT